ncbi:hypothetical protein ACFX2C_031966 [Malus domestica]
MRQSHGKNDWKIVATSSMLLACKLVNEVRFLNDIVFVGYEIGENSNRVKRVVVVVVLGRESFSGSRKI